MAKRVSKENLIEHTSFMFDNTNVLKRNTLYTYESTVNKGQIVLKCTTQGTTANTTLDLSSVSVGDLLSDGTAEWEVISVTGYGIGSGGGGGGSGSGSGYSQIGLSNISASSLSPYIVDIAIDKNATHVLPPIDVLKHMSGEYTVSTVMDFNSSDSSKFTYDEDCVKFEDSYMKINQEINVELGNAEVLGDNFVRISEPIDLSVYKSVESVVCK